MIRDSNRIITYYLNFIIKHSCYNIKSIQLIMTVLKYSENNKYAITYTFNLFNNSFDNHNELLIVIVNIKIILFVFVYGFKLFSILYCP
jgi:hypothetical protein